MGEMGRAFVVERECRIPADAVYYALTQSNEVNGMAFSSTVVDMAEVKARRNTKVSVVVKLARPAWIIDVKEIPEAQTVVFDLIFRPFPGDGWYRRRYEYDGEANVLHHCGEQFFPESELRTLPDSAEFKV